MNWIKVEDEQPPFDTFVLAWKTCEKCSKHIRHSVNLLLEVIPHHGPFIAKLHAPDPFTVQWYRNKGDHSMDHRLEPQWDPAKPSHWMKIESP